MATYNSNTVFDPTHPAPLTVLVEEPFTPFFNRVHNEQVTFRGISGRVMAEADHLYFYPDEAGFSSQAYRDDVAQLGGEWFRWYVGDDTKAMLEIAQAAHSPFGVNIDMRPQEQPGESETEMIVNAFLSERMVSVEVWPSALEDVTPFADWVDELLVLMGVD